MNSRISGVAIALQIFSLCACSQAGTAPVFTPPQQSSSDGGVKEKPPISNGNEEAKGDDTVEVADVPKVINGAYLYCQANDKLIDDKYLVKCQVRRQDGQHIDIAREGLLVQFGYEAKEEEGIFVDLFGSAEDKTFDITYVIAGRDYAELDAYSKGMTFKAEISEIQSGDSQTITLSGDRVTVTVVKTSNPPVVSK